MRFRTADEIRGKFAELRGICDPAGFDVLDALENACLVDNALLQMQDRVDELQARILADSREHFGLGPLGQLLQFPVGDGFSVKVGETS